MELKQFQIAIVGSGGVVAAELKKILLQRGVREKQIQFIPASEKQKRFTGNDLVFFATNASESARLVPQAVAEGCFVIDLSSHFRMDPQIPLIVPEVNPDSIFLAKKSRIIANPNCTTAQLVMVLHPLNVNYGLKRVIVSSYQAISGMGKQAMQSFLETQDLSSLKCVPQIGVLDELTDDSEEEIKVMHETQKILSAPQLLVQATCVRVPVLNGHSEVVNLELEKPATLNELRASLKNQAGLRLMDRDKVPSNLDVQGQDEVFVGRLRRDVSVAELEKGLTLWIVADNLRKGAALNAVQVAELCIKEKIVEKMS